MAKLIEVPGMGHVEFPDAMSDDEIVAAIKKNTPAPATSAAAPPQASLMDKVAGSALGRTAIGLASPLLGAAQAGAHLGDTINRATGTEPVVSPWIDKKLQELEASKKRGMASYGHDPESMDWWGLAGSLLPGAKIAQGVAKALPAATGPVGRAVLAAVQGGTIAAATPTTGDDFGSNKAMQTVGGAGLGMVGSAATDLVRGGAKVIGDVVKPLTEKGRAEILDLYQQGRVPESARERVAQALLSGRGIVPGSKPTAGELVAHVPEATSLASHQAGLERMSSPVALAPEFAARRGAQEGARLAAIEPIAGTADDMAKAVQMRADTTAPMREAALSQANVAGKSLPVLEKTIAKGEKGIQRATAQLGKLEPAAPSLPPDALRSAVEIHGVPPKPLVSQKDVLMKQLLPEQIAKRQSEIASAKEAIQQLQDNGLQPLKPDSILRSIKSSVSQPGLRASDVVTKTLGALEEKLDSLKSKTGTIDAQDLYMVRKEMGNTVKKFAEETKTFDQKLTSGILNNMQSAIDDAIEGAGGKGWKDYLKKYQELSQPINRMEQGGMLKEALRSPLETKERSTVFANAVNKNRDDLTKMLTQQEMGKVDKVMADLARYDQYKNLARQSSSGGADAIPGNVELALPNILSRPAMIANFIMRKIGEGAEEKIAKEAARRYLDDPGAIANALLRSAQPSRNQQIIDALMRQTPVAAGVAGGQAGR